MSGRPPIAISTGEPLPVRARELASIAERIVIVGPETRLAEIEALAATERAIWLPPWTVGDPALAAAIGEWLGQAGDAPQVALARRELVFGEVAIPLPRFVLLSTPGAVRVGGDLPAPRPAIPRTTIGARLRMRPPATLSEHLLAINRQTSEAALLSRDAGLRPTWSALWLRPTILVARALVGARGARRLALPRAVLEAYRGVLVNAKLWELCAASGAEPR
jgi:hypothetical protein